MNSKPNRLSLCCLQIILYSKRQGRNDVCFFHHRSHFCTQISDPRFQKRGKFCFLNPQKDCMNPIPKKQLILILWLVIPDPAAVIPDLTLRIADPSPVIPDPTYLVTSLKWLHIYSRDICIRVQTEHLRGVHKG